MLENNEIDLNKDKIVELYLNNHSILNICNKTGLGYKKIRTHLLKNNISLRKRNTKGLHNHSEETKNKMRVSKLGSKNINYKKCSNKTKEIFNSFRLKLASDENLKKIVYEKVSKTRIKRKLSVGKNNPMSRPEAVKKWAESNHLKPNKSEIKLFHIIEELFLGKFLINTKAEYLIIEGKIPDFVNIEDKKIIELYGDYWHRNESNEKQNKRINLFLNNGYKTLIIWEHELKNLEKLKIKLYGYCN